jgi:hypothetical protein
VGKPLALGVGASGLPASGDFANGVVSGTILGVGPQLPFVFWGPWNLVLYGALIQSLTVTNGSSAATLGANVPAGTAINSPLVPKGTTVASAVGTAAVLAFPTKTLTGFVQANSNILSGLDSTDGLVGATAVSNALPSGTTVLAVITPAVPGNNASPTVKGSVQLSNNALTTTANRNGYGQHFQFLLTSNSVISGTDAAAVFTGAGITYTGNIQVERSFDGGSTWIPCNIGGSGVIASYAAGTPVSLAFGEPEKGVGYRLNCLAYTSVTNLTITYRMSETGGAATSLSIGASI